MAQPPPPLAVWRPQQPTRWQMFCRDPWTVSARWLYARRIQHVLPPSGQPPVRIVCISDTHNLYPEVPDGDVLVHAGDLTNGGSFLELQKQLRWLSSLPHAHKIVIAGNHDRLLDPTFAERFPDRVPDCSGGPGTSLEDLDWGSLVYLNDTTASLTVRGPGPVADGAGSGSGTGTGDADADAPTPTRTLRVYGAPWTEQCGTFGFQYPPVRPGVWKDRIPAGTDIVVVHGPPRGHLDAGKGCPQLLEELRRARPALAVFGHIHEANGREDVVDNGVGRAYDAVVLGQRGLLGVLALAWWLLWDWLCTALAPRRRFVTGTRLVNAAMLFSGPEQTTREPIVVDM